MTEEKRSKIQLGALKAHSLQDKVPGINKRIYRYRGKEKLVWEASLTINKRTWSKICLTKLDAYYALYNKIKAQENVCPGPWVALRLTKLNTVLN